MKQRREDERLWDKVKKAKGPPIDNDALAEVNAELDRRAKDRGTTPTEERDRLFRRFKD